MKTARNFILGLLAATTLSGAAQAEERWPRWYVGLGGGIDFVTDSDFTRGATRVEAEYDTGYSLYGSIGYLPPASSGFFSQTRFEAEIAYHAADFDSLTSGATVFPPSGDVSIVSYMVNAYYDFNTSYTGLRPYIGGGLGLAQVEVDSTTINATDNEDSVLSYQAMLGIAYAPQTLPQTEWNLGYRYFGVSDPEFSNVGGNIDAEYDSHGIELGMKFRF